MHELGIAQNVINIVREELSSRQLVLPVKKVVFVAGRLNAIIPASLTFHFDALKNDMPQMTGAILEVKQMPIVAECEACKRTFEIEDRVFLCPRCDTPVSLKSGNEMLVESIVLEEE